MPNPILGVFLHWLGGVVSWIVAPWLMASIFSRDLLTVLHQAPPDVLGWCFLFGILWGFGGLTFGLTMRYLGLSLGMAVALGYTAVFGTLMPPIFRGQFPTLLHTQSGIVILIGVSVCVLGIVFA